MLGGCASMSETVVTTVTETTGQVTETVASASIAKEQAVHSTLQTEESGYYRALPKTGSKMGVTAYQEILLSDGSKAFLPLMTATFIEAPKRNTSLPTSPSVHPVWGVAKDAVKYGFLAYGVHEVSGLVSSLADGNGVEVTGDSNVIQGVQNKAGGDQSVDSGYTTCATGDCGTDPEEYYIDGNCYVSDGCSCESYAAGLCE